MSIVMHWLEIDKAHSCSIDKFNRGCLYSTSLSRACKIAKNMLHKKQ